ncbi:MAG: hypothetical protein A2792_09855 [Sphingomonadales bacterium RIFCSPHIGHO2_01_FULL_65_20]|nr:MAG: hypothetical protein A2792_09855 [Sphingomonadales bacterium RIFCSPHIGHO2_01_FULL_65_20]
MSAIVDDEDYDFLMQWKWYAAKQPNTFYAARTEKVAGHKVTIWMHRVINRTPDGMKTDHIGGDGLDNRRQNLRSVDHRDNMINNNRWVTGRYSRHRGVTWHKHNQRWQAQMTVERRNIFIGSFRTEAEAVAAFEAARRKFLDGKVYRK